MKFVYEVERLTEYTGFKYPDIGPDMCLEIDWIGDSEVMIRGNQSGLRWLAKLLITLAQPENKMLEKYPIDLLLPASGGHLTEGSKPSVVIRDDNFKDWPDEVDHKVERDPWMNYEG
ncbi:MAG: hypothetical protein H6751_13725 [Candidatus Omnitrophica bacterium]|nr:hypothetical protein [Candidatus Omnitrophota bacterium]